MLVSVTESDSRYIKAMQEFRCEYVYFLLYILSVLYDFAYMYFWYSLGYDTRYEDCILCIVCVVFIV